MIGFLGVVIYNHKSLQKVYAPQSFDQLADNHSLEQNMAL